MPASRSATSEALFWLTYGTWVVLEVGLAVRDVRRSSPVHGNRDRGTRRIFAAGIIGGFTLAFWGTSGSPSSRTIHGPGVVFVGSAVALAGVALRIWSVRTLGRYFRRSVTIESDHELVTRGPYAVVRHPSYTGGLLSGLGMGVATGHPLGLIGLFVIPLLALLPRIRVEERALTAALGDRYVQYRDGTAALVPGLW